MSNILFFLRSPYRSVLTINEHGYIFKSSDKKAENLAASQYSIDIGLTSKNFTIPEIEQLSKPILNGVFFNDNKSKKTFRVLLYFKLIALVEFIGL